MLITPVFHAVCSFFDPKNKEDTWVKSDNVQLGVWYSRKSTSNSNGPDTKDAEESDESPVTRVVRVDNQLMPIQSYETDGEGGSKGEE